MLRRGITGATVTLIVLGSSALASADSSWRLSVEGSLLVPVSEPQSSWFGPGGGLSLSAYGVVHESLALGVRLRGGGLSDGAPPTNPSFDDPGPADLWTAALSARWRPLSPWIEASSRAAGPFLDAGGGVTLSGGQLRPSVEAGVGWGFDLGPVVLAPTVRWLAVIEVDNALDDRPAHLLSFGVEAVFLDDDPPVAATDGPPPPSDRDGDGLLDAEDRCPDEPEDHDGFGDEDGCPDLDDDADGIPDSADGCPREPEDHDGFEDEDGCPDPDNDRDGWPDEEDACPNEAEVVNGVDDLDGCPDEGAVTVLDGRIVLDERVLFDFARARVRSYARPILRTIAELYLANRAWVQVRVEGHTDVRGSPEANQRLSEARARQVARVLVEYGIPAESIEWVGYGEARLSTTGVREGDHQRNRRVEFVVTSRRELTPEELRAEQAARSRAAAARRAEQAAERGGRP